MMLRLHPGSRSGSNSRHRPARQSAWLGILALLCVSLLFCASTAQACHAHDALLRSADGKAQISAPVDECPLCAAPHAALPAGNQTVVGERPQLEHVQARRPLSPHLAQWSFHLFSRPPPTA